MLRIVWRNSVYLCSAVIAPNQVKQIPESFEETGLDRVKKIFQLDEYDEWSPQLSNVYNTTVLTIFIGGCYGGFIHSRDAYLKFIEANEATKYADHFEAKKKLQDHVTTNFFKGALRWSWRLGLFGCMYVTGVSVLSAYRGSHSVIDYALSGCLSGLIYRLNYGLNGVIVGATLGGFVGLLAGSISLMVMRFSGTTYDDVSDWHKEHAYSRERHLKEAMEKSGLEESERVLLAEHDKRIKVS